MGKGAIALGGLGGLPQMSGLFAGAAASGQVFTGGGAGGIPAPGSYNWTGNTHPEYWSQGNTGWNGLVSILGNGFNAPIVNLTGQPNVVGLIGLMTIEAAALSVKTAGHRFSIINVGATGIIGFNNAGTTSCLTINVSLGEVFMQSDNSLNVTVNMAGFDIILGANDGQQAVGKFDTGTITCRQVVGDVNSVMWFPYTLAQPGTGTALRGTSITGTVRSRGTINVIGDCTATINGNLTAHDMNFTVRQNVTARLAVTGNFTIDTVPTLTFADSGGAMPDTLPLVNVGAQISYFPALVQVNGVNYWIIFLSPWYEAAWPSRIFGSVLTSVGAHPIPGTTVVATDFRGNNYQTSTDSSGNYTFGDPAADKLWTIPPGKPVNVQVGPFGSVAPPVAPGAVNPSNPQTVTTAVHASSELDFTVDQMGNITGQALLPEDPQVECQITVRNSQGVLFAIVTTTGMSGNTYQVEDPSIPANWFLPPDTYQVLCTPPPGVIVTNTNPVSAVVTSAATTSGVGFTLENSP